MEHQISSYPKKVVYDAVATTLFRKLNLTVNEYSKVRSYILLLLNNVDSCKVASLFNLFDIPKIDFDVTEAYLLEHPTYRFIQNKFVLEQGN